MKFIQNFWKRLQFLFDKDQLNVSLQIGDVIHFCEKTDDDGFSVNQTPMKTVGPIKSIFENQQHGFIQGNFNEQLMLNETDTFLNDLKYFIKKMKSIENLNGWICGLGHGINKNTPEKNVHLFIENIRKEFS